MDYFNQKQLVESYIADITDLEIDMDDHGADKTSKRKLKDLKKKLKEAQKVLKKLEKTINN